MRALRAARSSASKSFECPVQRAAGSCAAPNLGQASLLVSYSPLAYVTFLAT